ncbi:hypothetical protein K440DRAFT_104749 [Wilcoxina mikolae CBS 423.85]|nr:hypothetical protein K440DRAFT_104749 [Wilcoxina mikolae CBS 423.85]
MDFNVETALRCPSPQRAHNSSSSAYQAFAGLAFIERIIFEMAACLKGDVYSSSHESNWLFLCLKDCLECELCIDILPSRRNRRMRHIATLAPIATLLLLLYVKCVPRLASPVTVLCSSRIIFWIY